MKFSTAILPLLCTTAVGARSLSSLSPTESVKASLKVPGKNPIEFCKDPDTYSSEIQSVDLDPNPPAAGTKLVIKATGHVGKRIEKGAKVQLRVKYRNLITLINQTADFCDNVKKIGLECPIEEGPLTIQQDADLPSAIPAGRYDAFANVINADGEEIITCLQATVTFGES